MNSLKRNPVKKEAVNRYLRVLHHTNENLQTETSNNRTLKVNTLEVPSIAKLGILSGFIPANFSNLEDLSSYSSSNLNPALDFYGCVPISNVSKLLLQNWQNEISISKIHDNNKKLTEKSSQFTVDGRLNDESVLNGVTVNTVYDVKKQMIDSRNENQFIHDHRRNLLSKKREISLRQGLIHYIYFFNITAARYDLHIKDDCTHYCPSPMLWIPVVDQIFNIYRKSKVVMYE